MAPSSVCVYVGMDQITSLGHRMSSRSLFFCFIVQVDILSVVLWSPEFCDSMILKI
jgi:hypothetical protein